MKYTPGKLYKILLDEKPYKFGGLVYAHVNINNITIGQFVLQQQETYTGLFLEYNHGAPVFLIDNKRIILGGKAKPNTLQIEPL